MPTPKTVTKVTANGVEFTSEVDKAEYYLYELTRGALRDVGKFVRAEFKKNYYEHFKKHSGKAGKQLSCKVWSSKNTLYPRVEIGIKFGGIKGYSMQQEFGSSTTPRLGLLQKAVKENISTIRKIEAQYLDYINQNDAVIESKIHEEEMNDEDK